MVQCSINTSGVRVWLESNIEAKFTMVSVQRVTVGLPLPTKRNEDNLFLSNNITLGKHRCMAKL